MAIGTMDRLWTEIYAQTERGYPVGPAARRQFIVEMGSGNTCKNDKMKVMDMIDAVADADSGEYEIILKWQLFESAPPNVPLDLDVFEFAYMEARKIGYKTTASVFSVGMLEYLLTFQVPFVKIACRANLYDLPMKCPIQTYVSVPGESEKAWVDADVYMHCVPKYPADLRDYENNFRVLDCVSDHTQGWELLYKYNPDIIEKHFALERDPKNPDGGLFAVTPDELAEVL